MPSSGKASPARSQGAAAMPRRNKPRGTRSVGSPAHSNASGRLSMVINQFNKEINSDSFTLSPLEKTLLNDDTYIEQPRRASWWKKVNNSRDVSEVLDNNKGVANNVFDELEVISQGKMDFTMDLPESSDNESIGSIVIPQRKLFTQKENHPQNQYRQIVQKRDSSAKQNKTMIADKSAPEVGPRNLFNNASKRPRPVFPAALLNFTPDKTVANKTKELPAEVKGQTRNLFGDHPRTKQKNTHMFADFNFILSESEDEISDVEPKIFAFQKNSAPVRHISVLQRESSPTFSNTEDVEPKIFAFQKNSAPVRHSSVRRRVSSPTFGMTADVEPKIFAFQKNSAPVRHSSVRRRESSPTFSMTEDMEKDFFELLPSSTMVEKQIEATVGTTPAKMARLSKLSETIESIGAHSLTNKTKLSNKSETTSHDKTNRKTNDVSLKQKGELKAPVNVEIEVQEKQQDNIVTSQNILYETHPINDVEKTGYDQQGEENKEIETSLKEQADESNQENEEKIAHSHEEMEVSDRELEETDNQEEEQGDVEIEAGEQLEESDENIAEEMDVSDRELKETDNQEVEQCDEEIETDQQLEENEENIADVHGEMEVSDRELEKANNQEVEQSDEEIEGDQQIEENEENIIDNHGEMEVSDRELEKANNLEVKQSDEEIEADQQLEEMHCEAENYRDEDENYRNGIEINEKKTDDNNQNENEENSEVEQDIENEHEAEGEEMILRMEDDEEIECDNEEIEREVSDYDEQDQNQEIQDQSAECDNVQNDEVENEQNDDNEQMIPDESQEIDDDEEQKSETDDPVSEKEDQNESQEIHDESQEVHDESQEEEIENTSQGVHKQSDEKNYDADGHNESAKVVNDNEEEIQNESQEEIHNDTQEDEDDDQEQDNEELEMEEFQNESQEEIDNDTQEDVDDDQEQDNEELEMEEIQNESQEEIHNDTQEDEDDDQEQENEELEMEEIQNESQEEIENDSQEGEDDDQEQDNKEMEMEVQESEEQETDDKAATPNVSNDTTGRNRNKDNIKSPEAILDNVTNLTNSFTAKGRKTSIRDQTKSIFKTKHSLAPLTESTRLSDGTKNSSAEGSGWDSHRTTRRTLRQTFGRDFTPRKSLRAMVMEKSAKRQTAINEANAVLNLQHHQADPIKPSVDPQAQEADAEPSMECENEMDYEDNIESEVARRTRQTTLEMYLEKVKKENMERNNKIKEEVKSSLKFNPNRRDFLNHMPTKPIRRLNSKPFKIATKKRQKPCIISLEDLPPELMQDMKYKPPKRYQPRNASWITNRLYKFLETKLEPKYDYKARVRAERLVERIYSFAREAGRERVAPARAVADLKLEMARMRIVRTHFEFYNFFSDFMPLELKIKVVPDIVNDLPLPRNGLFADIIQEEQ